MILPDITGILSGRIRTDSFDHFTRDMLGLPSDEEIEWRRQRRQRLLYPDAKPGELSA